MKVLSPSQSVETILSKQRTALSTKAPASRACSQTTLK